MPILEFSLLPIDQGINFPRLADDLSLNICQIEELHLNKDDVTITFPSGLMKEGQDEEIIIWIKSLSHKPEQYSREVCQIVADRICQTAAENLIPILGQCKKVEVFLQTFNPLDQETFSAFSSWCRVMPVEVERAYSEVNDYVDQFISGLITDFPLDLRVRSMLLAAYNLDKNSLKLNPDSLGPVFVLSADRIKRGFMIDEATLNLINHSEALPHID